MTDEQTAVDKRVWHWKELRRPQGNVTHLSFVNVSTSRVSLM